MFPVSVYEPIISVGRKIILLLHAEIYQFCDIWGLSIMHSPLEIMPELCSYNDEIIITQKLCHDLDPGAGLWFVHSRTFWFSILSHSLIDLLESFASLSCWIVHFCFNFKLLLDGITFPSSILWYNKEVHVDSLTGASQAKQTQTVIFPPQGFIVGTRSLCSIFVFDFHSTCLLLLCPNNSILESIPKILGSFF